MNKRMDRRQQGRRQLGRPGVDRVGQVPRGTFLNHNQPAMMRSQLASPPLDQLNAYMELARQGILQGPAMRGTHMPALGPAFPQPIPLLSSGQGFYTVESLQGATSVPQGVLPPHSPLVAQDGPRVMGFGAPTVRQGYDSGMGNMHMMMNPLLGHEMLANGHPHPGSPLVAITSRPEQGLLGHMFAHGPPQHPHLPHVPLGFHPRSSSGPGPMYGWPQGRDHGEGWGRDRGGGRDLKGDWNHRHWDGHRESRQVERPFIRKGRVNKRNEQPSPPTKQSVPNGNDKKRKFPNAPGPGGPGWCTLCELECSTAEMLQQHRQGKRHKRNLQKVDSDADIGKEKTNSANSSAKGVTSEGDVSTGPSAHDAADTGCVARVRADTESQDQPSKALFPPASDSNDGTPELSTASEVEQSSKPTELDQEEMVDADQQPRADTDVAENRNTDLGAHGRPYLGRYVDLAVGENGHTDVGENGHTHMAGIGHMDLVENGHTDQGESAQADQGANDGGLGQHADQEVKVDDEHRERVDLNQDVQVHADPVETANTSEERRFFVSQEVVAHVENDLRKAYETIEATRERILAIGSKKHKDNRVESETCAPEPATTVPHEASV